MKTILVAGCASMVSIALLIAAAYRGDMLDGVRAHDIATRELVEATERLHRASRDLEALRDEHGDAVREAAALRAACVCEQDWPDAGVGGGW